MCIMNALCSFTMTSDQVVSLWSIIPYLLTFLQFNFTLLYYYTSRNMIHTVLLLNPLLRWYKWYCKRRFWVRLLLTFYSRVTLSSSSPCLTLNTHALHVWQNSLWHAITGLACSCQHFQIVLTFSFGWRYFQKCCPCGQDFFLMER